MIGSDPKKPSTDPKKHEFGWVRNPGDHSEHENIIQRVSFLFLASWRALASLASSPSPSISYMHKQNW